MSKPAESVLLEEGDHALESRAWVCSSTLSLRFVSTQVFLVLYSLGPSSTEGLGVCHEVRPFDGQNTPLVPLMECIESRFPSGVECPWVTVKNNISPLVREKRYARDRCLIITESRHVLTLSNGILIPIYVHRCAESRSPAGRLNGKTGGAI